MYKLPQPAAESRKELAIKASAQQAAKTVPAAAKKILLHD